MLYLLQRSSRLRGFWMMAVGAMWYWLKADFNIKGYKYQPAETYFASATRPWRRTSEMHATWSNAIQLRSRDEDVVLWCLAFPRIQDKRLEWRRPTALEFPVDPEVSMKQTMSSCVKVVSGKTRERASR